MPLDMRAGTETALARVVPGLRQRQTAPCLPLRQPAHHARMKVLVHDGIGVWLAARRLHQGPFRVASGCHAGTHAADPAPVSGQALVLGLPGSAWKTTARSGCCDAIGARPMRAARARATLPAWRSRRALSAEDIAFA